jgi:MFS family permease
MNIRKQMPRFVLLRSLLVFTLVGVIWFAFSSNILTGLILIFLGFAYAMYYIMMLSLSMELIPQGRTGFFDGLVSLGAAIGAFFGPFLANDLNYLLKSTVESYLVTFLITAVLFLVAFIALKLFARSN